MTQNAADQPGLNRFDQKIGLLSFQGHVTASKIGVLMKKKTACATIVTIIKRFIQYIGFHILRMHESHRVSFAQLMNITDKSRLTF